jgi:hypothetical protein
MAKGAWSGGTAAIDAAVSMWPSCRLEDRSAFRFLSGNVLLIPRWASDESGAVPLILLGLIGELCVYWNPLLLGFILLYNGGSPPGIFQHQSRTLWRPWTGGENIFDTATTFGHYIHIANFTMA